MTHSADSLAKITRPSYAGIFQRKRLFKLFDTHRKSPIIWITAPPGSGKTILVSSYIETRKIQCLWYQVDARDDDAATFFYYLSLAAKKAAPSRRPLPLFTPEYTPALATFARRYFEDLYGRLKQPSCVVFDNYQEVYACSVLHEAVKEGLEAIPDGVTVIFISRQDPPPALAKMRATKMASVGWDDVSLTKDESLGIIRLKTGGCGITSQAAEELHLLTNGWAAGLVLLIERLKKGERLDKNRFDTDAIFDYFDSEILIKLDPGTRSFLFKTALLSEMDSEAAESLSGEEGAGRILKNLNRSNCFTAMHMRSHPIYQYHPLFREFLNSKSTEFFSPEEMRGLKIKAGDLLNRKENFEDAFSLYHEAGHVEGIIGMVMANAQLLLMQGRHTVVEKWITSLPQDILDNSPWLLFWLGNCRMLSAPPKDRFLLERAFELFDEQKDAVGVYLAWAALTEWIHYEWASFTQSEPLIEKLYKLRDRYPFPSPEIEARVTTCMFAMLTFHLPGHKDIGLWEGRARMVMQAVPDDFLRLSVGNLIFLYSVWLGDAHKTTLIMDSLKPIIRSPLVPPVIRLMWYVNEAFWNWHMTEPADQVVEDALLLAKTTGVHVFDNKLLSQAVCSSVMRGETEKASQYLKDLRPIVGTNAMDVSLYYFVSSIDALIREDYGRALEYGKAALEHQQMSMPFATATIHVAMANAYAGMGDLNEAAESLESASAIAEGTGSRNLQFMCHVTAAFMATAVGDDEKCLDMLRAAMTLAAKNGIVCVFFTPRTVWSVLAARALEAGIEVEHVKTIIRKNNLVPIPVVRHVEAWPWPIRIYTLGRFVVVKDGEPIKFTKKAQQKPFELLKALIALGGRNVSDEQLADTLWPDSDGDTAHDAFTTTLYRLRQLLGCEDALELRERRLTLAPGYCWVDVWSFDRITREIENGIKNGCPEQTVRLMEKAVDMYQGDFLSGDEDKPWTVSLREYLKNRLIHLVKDMGQHLEEKGDLETAIRCFNKGLEADDLIEEFYQRLMRCHYSLGCRAEGLSVYNRLKKALSSAFGINPSPKTEEILTSLLAE